MPNVQDKYAAEGDIIASVRPEELLMQKTSGDGGLKAVIDDCVFLGLNTHYFMHLEDGVSLESIQESSIDSIIAPGTKITLTINTGKVNLFSADGKANILKGTGHESAQAL
jgi:iron(III) transport system ATP-binding protein